MSGQAQIEGPRARRRRARARRDRIVAGAAALTGHGLLLWALLASRPPPPLPPEPPEPFEVALVAPAFRPAAPTPPAPQPEPEPAPAASAPAASKTPEPPKPAHKPPPVRLIREPEPSDVPPRVVPPPERNPPAPEIGVSEAQLASAMTAEREAAGLGGPGTEGEGSGAGAGGGGGGGRCDMVARLQRALRDDPRVRTAIAQVGRAPGFASRPLVVWNGDWVRHGEEEGKGLASVRQAISVEVAFAPKTCRSQSMHGLVVLSLNDAPGAARLVLGAGFWRWSDLLFAR